MYAETPLSRAMPTMIRLNTSPSESTAALRRQAFRAGEAHHLVTRRDELKGLAAAQERTPVERTKQRPRAATR
jgi:hypothetical protein